MITLPIFRTRTQLSLGCGILNSPVAYCTTCTNTLRCINQTIMETICSPTSAALACSFDYLIKSHPYTLVRFNPPGVSLHPIIQQQSPNTFYSMVRRTEISIICIGSESCLWSIVGLPGSYAYYLTFRSIGQGSKGRTTTIVSWFIRMSTSVEKAEN